MRFAARESSMGPFVIAALTPGLFGRPLRAKQRSVTERSGREEPLARTQTTSYPHARLMGARKPRRDLNRGRRLLAPPESSQWR